MVAAGSMRTAAGEVDGGRVGRIIPGANLFEGAGDTIPATMPRTGTNSVARSHLCWLEILNVIGFHTTDAAICEACRWSPIVEPRRCAANRSGDVALTFDF
jgi:hypothetical protein